MNSVQKNFSDNQLEDWVFCLTYNGRLGGRTNQFRYALSVGFSLFDVKEFIALRLQLGAVLIVVSYKRAIADIQPASSNKGQSMIVIPFTNNLTTVL